MILSSSVWLQFLFSLICPFFSAIFSLLLIFYVLSSISAPPLFITSSFPALLLILAMSSSSAFSPFFSLSCSSVLLAYFLLLSSSSYCLVLFLHPIFSIIILPFSSLFPISYFSDLPLLFCYLPSSRPFSPSYVPLLHFLLILFSFSPNPLFSLLPSLLFLLSPPSLLHSPSSPHPQWLR
jgi:hypothetical protein